MTKRKSKNAAKKNRSALGKGQSFTVGKKTELGKDWTTMLKEDSYSDFLLIVSPHLFGFRPSEENYIFLNRFTLSVRAPDLLRSIDSFVFEGDESLQTIDDEMKDLALCPRSLSVLIEDLPPENLLGTEIKYRLLGPGTVHIEHEDPELFRRFFAFIYGGFVSDLPFWELIKLFNLAEKFNYTGLVSSCAVEMDQYLTRCSDLALLTKESQTCPPLHSLLSLVKERFGRGFPLPTHSF